MTHRIPKYQQDAFRALANALIFIEPMDYNISRENVRVISKIIQEEFMRLDTLHQKKIHDETWGLVMRLEERLHEISPETHPERKKEQEKKEHGLLKDQHIQWSEKEFVEVFPKIFSGYRELNDDIKYHGWGFTPKLSQGNEKLMITRNCFGVAASLGAYFKEKGIRTGLGITPDHSYVFAYLEDGSVYCAGGEDAHRLYGTMDSHNLHEVYYPAEQEQFLPQMFLIFDFDHAVLYEILESMEVLRRLSLGKGKVPELYEIRDLATEIIKPHKKLIERINWKDLQARLFPEIVAAFKQHKRKWSREVRRIAIHRKRQHILDVFKKAIKDAFQETSLKEGDVVEGLTALFTGAYQNQQVISRFLREGVELPGDLNGDVKHFFTFLKFRLLEEGILTNVLVSIEKTIITTGTKAAKKTLLTEAVASANM